MKNHTSLVLFNFILFFSFTILILSFDVRPKSFGDDTFHNEAKIVASFLAKSTLASEFKPVW